MPRKAKYTKEDFIDSALEIAREKGLSAVTAREIGARLECSTRPMFTYFDSVEELKSEVIQRAFRMFEMYMENETFTGNSLLPVGLAVIGFAKKEPSLYELTATHGEGLKKAMDIVTNAAAEPIMRECKLSRDNSICACRHIFLCADSLARLISDDRILSDEEAELILRRESYAILKAIRENSGFQKGNFAEPSRKRQSFESWID